MQAALVAASRANAIKRVVLTVAMVSMNMISTRAIMTVLDQRSGNASQEDTGMGAFAAIGRAVAPSALAGAALMAWLLQPLLPFVDGSGVYLGGLLISMGMMTVARSLMPSGTRLGTAFGIAGTFAGFVILAHQFDNASARYEANDVRCAGIEREMSLPAPRRADLPELFQAWACRPQTNFAVQVIDQDSAKRGLVP